MRGKVVLAVVVAAACVAAAWVYFSPAAMGSLQQMLPGARQTASADTPAAAGKNSADKAGGKSGAGGNAARSASIVSATATTADFPIRRYAIGFVVFAGRGRRSMRACPARSSSIDGQGRPDGEGRRPAVLARRPRAEGAVGHDQATLAKDQALLVERAGRSRSAPRTLPPSRPARSRPMTRRWRREKAAAATVDADQATLDADTGAARLCHDHGADCRAAGRGERLGRRPRRVEQRQLEPRRRRW